MTHSVGKPLALFVVGIMAVGCGGAGGDAGSDAAASCPSGNCSPVCSDGTFLSGGACVATSACPPGTYIAQASSEVTDRICATCPSGTFSAAANSVSCTSWSVCNPGNYVSVAPSATTDRGCARCPAGTLTSSANQSSCLASEDCPAGTVQTGSGTASSAPVCAPCRAGQYCAGASAAAASCMGDTWDDDGNPATACVDMTICNAGTSISQPGSATANRSCTICAPGSFSTMNNMTSCTPWSNCPAGTFVSNLPTAAVDRICTPCAAGTSATADNQSACLATTSCAAGTVQTAAATTTAARLCRSCSSGEFCAGGLAAAVSCTGDTWDDDGNPSTACAVKTLCAPGAYVSQSGSPTTDRACSPCASGSFSTTTNAAACSTWSTCPAGSQVVTPPSASNDRLCAACAAATYSKSENQSTCLAVGDCAAGTVQTRAATSTSAPVCAPCSAGEYCAGHLAPAAPCVDDSWDNDGNPATACVGKTVCKAGAKVDSPGSATTDRICVSCTSGSFSTVDNAVTCAAWTDCPAGSYSTFPWPTTDRGCAPCAAGTYSASANLSSCLPVGVCQAGTVQTRAATPTSPPVCAPCSVGAYCAGHLAPAAPCVEDNWDNDGNPATACVGKTVCKAGAKIDSPGSATTDQTCVACTSGSFSTVDNAVTCAAWTDCPAGSYATNLPSTTTDRACTPCAESTYSASANLSSCLPAGECQAGTVQTAAATSTSPTVCEVCSAGEYCAGDTETAQSCGNGTWDNDLNPATACVGWALCQPGLMLAPGSATTNPVCAPACALHMHYNLTQGACNCDDLYAEHNGSCQLCPAPWIYTNGVCTCVKTKTHLCNWP